MFIFSPARRGLWVQGRTSVSFYLGPIRWIQLHCVCLDACVCVCVRGAPRKCSNQGRAMGLNRLFPSFVLEPIHKPFSKLCKFSGATFCNNVTMFSGHTIVGFRDCHRLPKIGIANWKFSRWKTLIANSNLAELNSETQSPISLNYMPTKRICFTPLSPLRALEDR